MHGNLMCRIYHNKCMVTMLIIHTIHDLKS